MPKKLLFALCLIGTALLASCGNAPPIETVSSATNTDYPSTPPAFTGLPAKRPTTKVLTEFAANAVSSFSTDGRIVFDSKRSRPNRTAGELIRAKTDAPDTQAVGTILVSPPTEEAPYGFLRRIDKITTAPDGSSVIETSEASLQEAIAGVDIKPEQTAKKVVRVPIDVTLAPTRSGLDTRQLMPQFLPRPTREVNGVKPRFNVPIIEDPNPPEGRPVYKCQIQNTPVVGGSKLEQSACITIRLWATVDIDVGWWWWFPYLRGFGARLNGYAGLNMNTNLISMQIENSFSTPLPGNFHYDLVNIHPGVVTFFIGPIPIVIAPQLGVGVNLGEGQLLLRATASTIMSSSLPAFYLSLGSDDSPLQFGFSCGNTLDNGNWGCAGINNIGEEFGKMRSRLAAWNPLSSPLSINTSAQLDFQASYTGKLSLTAGIYLYGVLGMSAAIEPYIRPQINMNIMIPSLPSGANTRTELYGGINGGVKTSISMGLHFLFINFDKPIYETPLVPDQSIVTFVKKCWTAAGSC
jgi:hypothetical protein